MFVRCDRVRAAESALLHGGLHGSVVGSIRSRSDRSPCDRGNQSFSRRLREAVWEGELQEEVIRKKFILELLFCLDAVDAGCFLRGESRVFLTT